jgi:competence protein ComEC
MPAEAAALLLDLIGLGAPLWFVAGAAIDALLWVAHTVGNARGAVAMLATMPPLAFAAMVAGGLWICLWTSRVRFAGLLPFLAGAAGAALAPEPDLLVTGDGRHMAIVADDGRPMLLRERSGNYIRRLLSEAAGFDDDPGALDGSRFGSCSRDSCTAALDRGGRRWQLLATRSTILIDWPILVDACARADIVVSDRWLPSACTPRWLKLDRRSLEQTGGVAIYLDGEPRVETVAKRVGQHPWATSRRKSDNRQRFGWRRAVDAAIRDRA